jgi:hypothetical protein
MRSVNFLECILEGRSATVIMSAPGTMNGVGQTNELKGIANE